MKKYLLIIGLILATLFISCAKNINYTISTTNSVDIKGDWSLVSHSVQYESDIQSLTSGFQTYDDTVYNYTTMYNHGGITITSDSIYSTGLIYSFADTLHIHQFADSVMTRDTVFQDRQAIYVTLNTIIRDSSTPYKKIGTDSLYFPNGEIYLDPIAFWYITIESSGAKVSVVGNLLTLTSVIDQSNPYPYDIGVPGAFPVFHIHSVVKTIFEKK